MAEKVVWHIGLPKTGTTYLQSIAWGHREQLLEAGVLLPGRGARQHLWASCVVREQPNVAKRDPRAPAAWSELVEEIARWEGTALISHEFFCGASADQVRRAMADLGDAEVHVVITVREIVGLVTARWQEWVKNGARGEIDAYPSTTDYRSADDWGWATLDLADVLGRWAAELPPEQVHVITPPGVDDARDLLWRRFARAGGLPELDYETASHGANESLGVVEVELLRRVNEHLRFTRPVDRGVWLRGYLAQDLLIRHGRERFWPSLDRVEELREIGSRGVEAVLSGGYDVIGSVDDLRTPAVLEPRRRPDQVSADEMTPVAVETIAQLLTALRDTHHQRTAAEHERDALRGELDELKQLREPLSATLRRRVRARRGQ